MVQKSVLNSLLHWKWDSIKEVGRVDHTAMMKRYLLMQQAMI
jgi:hypothetical protein